MFRRQVSFAAFIAFWAFQAYAACPESGFKYEQNMLRQVLDGKATRVFFVDVFGGPWPIPNRYEVNRYENANPPKIRLASPSNVLAQLLPSDCFYHLIGHISIGSYEKEVEPRGKAFNSKHDISTRTWKSGNLEIKVNKWKPKTRPGRVIISVLIHNDDQFIKITDEDPKLWELMLDVHRALKAKEPVKN